MADKPKKTRIRVMALDSIPAGEGEFNADTIKEQKKTLPEGVTSKMLYGDVLDIAWPSFVELFLTQVAAMVNMMMVGGLGASAIAAVGLTTQPRFLLMTFFMALNVGSTAMVARSKGAGNQERANLFMRQVLMINFGLTLLVSVAGYATAGHMIRFMAAGGQTEETIIGGIIYLRIQMLGFLFFAITATITAALRGAGETRVAMVYNLVANVVNVFTGFLIIYGRFGFPRLELVGASIALVFGQFVAFVLAMWSVMSGRYYLHLRFKDGFMPNKDAITQVVRIGFPSMLEQLAMRVGMIIFNLFIAGLGTVAFATHQITMNIQAMSFMTGQAFAVSGTSLVGQSLGRKRLDMAHHYASKTRRIGMCVAILMGITFFFFGRQIVGLYTYEAEIIAMGGGIMMMMAFILPFQNSQFILAGALRGAGDTKATAVIVFITVLFMRPIMGFITINAFELGLWGAWITIACDQLVRTGLVMLRFYSGKWMSIKGITG